MTGPFAWMAQQRATPAAMTSAGTPPQPKTPPGPVLCVLCPTNNRQPVALYADNTYPVCTDCYDEFVAVYPVPADVLEVV